MFEDYGSTKRTEFFGTYRVDLVVTLFSRVLDLHNFEVVMHCLTPFEVACTYCRIGWYVTFIFCNFFLMNCLQIFLGNFVCV